MKHARINNKTYIRTESKRVSRCMICDKILNGRGKPNKSGICSRCSGYSKKRRLQKLHMLKKEHLYTFDDADRLVELDKHKTTKIPIK